MKRIAGVIAWVFAIIIHFTSWGQERADDKSLLWKISGKGLTNSSYLFGTMHQLCPGDYVWTDKMKASLEKSDKVCFEMNMSDPNLLTQVTAGLLDLSGKKLKDYFTPDQYQHIKQYMKDSLGFDITMFEQLKPVALESMIGLREGNCNDPVSYEETIMKTAVNENKEIMGLEEAKEQLDVLETMPVDSVVKELVDAVERPAKDNDAEYQTMINAYKQQDIAKLYELIKQSKDMGDGLDAFLDIRNKKWIPRMADKMNKNAVFFAVGAGHLWGDNGVISLLRKDGYKVEPVK